MALCACYSVARGQLCASDKGCFVSLGFHVSRIRCKSISVDINLSLHLANMFVNTNDVVYFLSFPIQSASGVLHVS